MKDGKDIPPNEMEPEDDALNRLLARAKSPAAVSPYFARRVLREVAALEDNRSLAAAWTQRWRQGFDFMLRLPRMAYSGGALATAAVAAVMLALLPHTHNMSSDSPAPRAVMAVTAPPTGAAEELTSQDVDVIADLDNLMALEENRLWTDDNNSL